MNSYKICFDPANLVDLFLVVKNQSIGEEYKKQRLQSVDMHPRTR